ncbi:hypothetical protein HMI55_004021 [Coelomomyces lativittatus]|nr:hypothetical protein HMI55_004021 [Coelomomyces lativittatus]
MDFVKPKVKSFSISQLSESIEPAQPCIDSGTDLSKNQKTQSSITFGTSFKSTTPAESFPSRPSNSQAVLESARCEISLAWLRNPPSTDRLRAGNEVWGPTLQLTLKNSLPAKAIH